MFRKIDIRRAPRPTAAGYAQRWPYLLAVALLLLPFGCSSVRQPLVPPISSEEGARQSVRRVLDALSDALSTHDLGRYGRLFSEEAIVVRGRSEQPGPYDVTRRYPSLVDPLQSLIFPKRKKPMELRVVVESIEIRGDRAFVRSRLLQSDKGVIQQVHAERYQLEQRDGRWRIRFNRYWTLERRIGGKLVPHGAAYWHRSDRHVDVARREKDPTTLLLALFDAHRFREAFELSRKLVEREPQSARFWFALGRSAQSLGDWRTAVTAFRKTSALNPDAPVPEPIRFQRIDRRLCHALQRRAIECRVPSLFIGTRQICRKRMGQFIRDYERLSSWARMGCEDLRQAWGARLRNARLRAIETVRRQLRSHGVRFCSKLLPLTTEKVGCYYNSEVVSLAPLSHLKSLRELHLVKTSVRDLSPLHGLAQLRVLNLQKTPVPTREIEAIKRALPQLRVIR